jgi:hypothetical protein
MSFNRVKYDECAFKLQMERSTTPGNYRLFGLFAENCDQCLSYDGPVGSRSDVSLVRKPTDLSFKDMADVESELSWRSTSLSKCNITSTLSERELFHKPVCTKKLTPEDTRFTHPLDNYRGMSLTDYQLEPYLPVNPQCHIQPSYDRNGLNSRLTAKDSYRMPKANFMDNGEALPKENPTKKTTCNL